MSLGNFATSVSMLLVITSDSDGARALHKKISGRPAISFSLPYAREFDAAQDEREFGRREHHALGICGNSRQLEGAPLQSLVPDAQASFLPPEKLHAIPTLIEKCIESPLQHIPLHMLDDDLRQTIESFTHVGRSRGQPDRHARCKCNHAPRSNTESTIRSMASSQLDAMRTLTPAESNTSIGAVVLTAGPIVTGTSAGTRGLRSR